MAAIDYDRGCIIRIEPTTGMDVVMYRREPGIYYTGTGREVPEALAKRAGFDTDAHARARAKREKLAQFAQLLDREEADDHASLSAKPKDVVYEAEGFKVISLGGGRHAVEDIDANVLTGKGKFVTREVAIKLVDEMVEGERARLAKLAEKAAKPKPAPGA